jgi:rhamnose utilization protein RhaD (predicted bifunctional aldolase and dehydrogenase)/NAD(P)-dependent dehydrogenase (short-subunit alcohol dehydrogenase family)
MTTTPVWPAFEAAEMPLEQLIKLSHYYGSDVEFVIAGGGNTSVKIGDRLLVKSSGKSLASVKSEGFVEMKRDALADLLNRDLGSDPNAREAEFKEAIMAARVHPEVGQRPSVECVLHSTLPRRFVVHTHQTQVNMICCCRNGEALAKEMFGDEILWIPYVDPGFTLAKTLSRGLADYANRTGRDCPIALLMQNHGLIVCAETPEQIRECTDLLVGKIRARLSHLPDGHPFGPVRRIEAGKARALINMFGPVLRALLANGDALKVVTFDDSETALSLAGSQHGHSVVLGGPLTPDQIVYCNSFPLWFEPSENEPPEALIERLKKAIESHIASTNFPPLVIQVEGLGMFTAGDDFAQADTVRLCYLDAIKVMSGAHRLGGIRPLSARERGFIEYWEVEAYRRKVAAGSRRRGHVAGKVAVVTGAAQGFGLEIAQNLAAEGAHVVLGDIKVQAAEEHAGALTRCWGSGRAVAIGMTVTDGASIKSALHQIIRTYGGLDLLISNAGVLYAGSVKTQPEQDFDLVTQVNYKGFFLCVQNAAPIMALQRKAKPDCWSDIIQINSKSGLAGSNRNGAYAGSKFGGIGLTQSFALELIEDGIKVNAICPGNFFDGPLWSDPETGLFVQYLRTGKVPGAKSIDEVKRFYEAKVPMGRGCTTADVMKAIYYVIAQQYETGQALPVTGGQVMLS